jgi:hypothetical protein
MVIMKKSNWHRWVFAGLLALALLLPTPRVEGQEARAVFIVETAPPPEIETYPYVVYEGQPVYHVHDRWYYRHGREWVYYREPPERLRHVRQHELRRYREHEARAAERDRARAREARAAARAHDRHERNSRNARREERREDRRDDRRDDRRETYVAPRAR